MLAPDILLVLVDCNKAVGFATTPQAESVLSQCPKEPRTVGGHVVADVNAIVDAATDAGLRIMAL